MNFAVFNNVKMNFASHLFIIFSSNVLAIALLAKNFSQACPLSTFNHLTLFPSLLIPQTPAIHFAFHEIYLVLSWKTVMEIQGTF